MRHRSQAQLVTASRGSTVASGPSTPFRSSRHCTGIVQYLARPHHIRVASQESSCSFEQPRVDRLSHRRRLTVQRRLEADESCVQQLCRIASEYSGQKSEVASAGHVQVAPSPQAAATHARTLSSSLSSLSSLHWTSPGIRWLLLSGRTAAKTRGLAARTESSATSLPDPSYDAELPDAYLGTSASLQSQPGLATRLAMPCDIVALLQLVSLLLVAALVPAAASVAPLALTQAHSLGPARAVSSRRLCESNRNGWHDQRSARACASAPSRPAQSPRHLCEI